MDKRTAALELLNNPDSTPEEKALAQKILDSIAAAPARKQEPRVRHYMDWIPPMTDEESSNFLEMQASVRARVFAAAAAERAEAAAKIVALAPTRKEQLLAVVNDAASSETQTLEAKLELATLEIDEFHEARARRRMGDTDAC